MRERANVSWKRVWVSGMFLALSLGGCGKDSGNGNNPPGRPQPIPLPVPGRPNPTPTPPPVRPGDESYDLLDNTFRDTAGWQVDSTGYGRQSGTGSGLELSVRSPFESSRCGAASVTLLQPGLLKNAKEATIELALSAPELPKKLEYQLRLQAYVGPGRRLISFTPRGVRSFNSDASFLVSPDTLTAGEHTVRLVANSDLTALYLDGKKLGSYAKGYLPGGSNPGDLVIELAAFDKSPVRSGEDCSADTTRVTLKKLRVATKAYFLP